MTMKEVSDCASEFADIDISADLSSVEISDNQGTLTADKLLDELPTPQHQPLYTTEINSSRSTYDQFFEEVSLDLPRDAQADTSYEPPSRLMKFIPRRANSQASTKTNNPSRNSFHADTSMKITTSDISGPFYSISDVLDDASQQDTSANTLSPEGGEFHSIDMSPNPRAARRNVNEAEVVVTSGGASLPVKRTLNPFKRNKVIHQKPSPLESVISKTRPRMLPPKDPQEEKKHLQEYEAMMKKARKLEAKKQKESYKKKEEKDRKINQAQQVWENDIIPHWKARAKDKRTLILWTQGIPPRCRKKVWKLKIGNSLDVNKSTFTECMRRAPHAIRIPSKSTNGGLASPTSHGSPMPIITPGHPTTYDAYAEQSLYPRRRQRRTSSLDVLREELKEEKLSYKEDNESITTTTDDGDETDLEEDTTPIDFNSNVERSLPAGPFGERHGVLGLYDESVHKTNNVIEVDANQHLDDIHLELEGDRSEGEEEDASSHDEDIEEEALGDNKILHDPALVNFLNKTIDEDIVRTLPSLCVFQPDGPLFMSLRKVLYAYVGYRHDLTYVNYVCITKYHV
ncbi:hypothetical protein BD560DRAFT_190472 [Blakeslea trispora]|nr:hypothetical protein BD560DRAFT_190472 [Blakeslea trispora]